MISYEVTFVPKYRHPNISADEDKSLKTDSGYPVSRTRFEQRGVAMLRSREMLTSAPALYYRKPVKCGAHSVSKVLPLQA
jgi:hypothetical protein